MFGSRLFRNIPNYTQYVSLSQVKTRENVGFVAPDFAKPCDFHNPASHGMQAGDSDRAGAYIVGQSEDKPCVI